MKPLHFDPEWPRASEWLAGNFNGELPITVKMFGVPWNNSISPGRADLAPDAIRAALAKFSTFDPEKGVDLRTVGVHDLGNIDPATLTQQMREQTGLAILLGGDNGLTRAGVHGIGVDLSRVGVLTFDAHLDVRTLNGGHHNGNPIRALIEDGVLGEHIIQLGISPFANSREYWDYAQGVGITSTTLAEVREQGLSALTTEALDRLAKTCDAIYIDLDIDVLDRAFTPGTPGARPGGLTPHEVSEAAYLCGLHPLVRAIDLVEIDPETDQSQLSALAAARFLLSFVAGVSQRL